MLPKFNNILYSTDFSDSSINAFKYVVYLAKTTGANIHVLHVVEKLSTDAKITLRYITNSDNRHKLLKERVKSATEILQERQDRFWSNLPVEDQVFRAQIKSSQVIEAYPAETILTVSKEINADVIIIGTHQRGVIHTFLGSIAKSVLRRTVVPVLVVPAPKEKKNKREKTSK